MEDARVWARGAPWGMAFPNLIGVVLMSGQVKALLDDYFARLRAAVFEPVVPVAGAQGAVSQAPERA